jgi:hypothetical protein
MLGSDRFVRHGPQGKRRLAGSQAKQTARRQPTDATGRQTQRWHDLRLADAPAVALIQASGTASSRHIAQELSQELIRDKTA